jgi:hypothetical protein
MRFSKVFPPKEKFFASKRRLSDLQARFFVLEEAVLLCLIVIQAYGLTGLSIVNRNVFVIQQVIPIQNYLWFCGLVFAFIISYFVIAKRDLTVQLIHKELFRVVFSEARHRVFNLNARHVILVFTEIVFAVLIALSIFLYLDPEVNINYPDGSPIPFAFKAVAFVIFLGIGLLLFSHTKQARFFYYGSVSAHKASHHGSHELRRSTNRRTGSIRIHPRHKHRN